jgi:hypothetical protein
MTDAALLRAAIDASGLEATTVWRSVLGHADMSNLYKVLGGTRALPNAESRIICTVILSDPALAAVFVAAADALAAGSVGMTTGVGDG